MVYNNILDYVFQVEISKEFFFEKVVKHKLNFTVQDSTTLLTLASSLILSFPLSPSTCQVKSVSSSAKETEQIQIEITSEPSWKSWISTENRLTNSWIDRIMLCTVQWSKKCAWPKLFEAYVQNKVGPKTAWKFFISCGQVTYKFDMRHSTRIL